MKGKRKHMTRFFRLLPYVLCIYSKVTEININNYVDTFPDKDKYIHYKSNKSDAMTLQEHIQMAPFSLNLRTNLRKNFYEPKL